MHILIAAITALAGFAWALHSLQNSGLDLNAFNPFYWVRRRQWQKQLGTKAIHRLENPMEAATLLIVATARLDGDITREHKQEIIQLFITEFSVTSHTATEFLAVASHMLANVFNITEEVRLILAPSISKYLPRHKVSLLEMMNKTAQREGAASKDQQALIDAVKRELDSAEELAKPW